MFAGSSIPAEFPQSAIDSGREIFVRSRLWLTPRRIAIGLLALLAILPVVQIGMRVADVSRNVVYWDEFDTALALVLRLDEGITPAGLLAELFTVNNEHRMVTSRLLYATSYWLTGTVNFAVITFIGNAWLLVACGLLLATAATTDRRVRLAVVLGCILFQLENYENFLWSGASIDHFQVVMLATVAVVALSRGHRTGSLLAGLAALLASLTLAHGLLLWPLGALVLWRARRSRELAGWIGLGLLVALGYAVDFEPNRGHSFAILSLAGAEKVIRYWLTLLGAVPALGPSTLAPFLGLALLGVLAWLGWRGSHRAETVAYPLAWFGAAALALVALGRAETANGVVHSRYLVLGALSWALAAFMAVERFTVPHHPFRALAVSLPILVGFNVAANHRFEPLAQSWVECRDCAVARFKQRGEDGRGRFSLHPVPAHATELLREAEQRGIYRMGAICLPRSFPPARPSARIAYFVDDLTVNARSVYVEGWAAIPGLESRRGELQLVLRSAAATHVYSTVSVQRPDVAQALQEPGWRHCGFRFARRRDRLPTGEFQIGFVLQRGGRSEYIMTEHRVVLTGAGQALLARAP